MYAGGIHKSRKLALEMWKPDDTDQDGSQKIGGIAAAYLLERGEENYLLLILRLLLLV